MFNIFKKKRKCEHEWQTISADKVDVYDSSLNPNRPVATKRVYIQECQKCHEMRKYEFDI